MGQYIHITKEVRKHLMKVFKCTSVMIWKALNFESDSDLARKIRKTAYENYGILMSELPSIETFHDHDNYMRQYLPNGAMLELSKNDASGDVFFKGLKVRHYDCVMLNDIESIQNWAMTLR